MRDVLQEIVHAFDRQRHFGRFGHDRRGQRRFDGGRRFFAFGVQQADADGLETQVFVTDCLQKIVGVFIVKEFRQFLKIALIEAEPVQFFFEEGAPFGNRFGRVLDV